jgi:hypothetical protein
MIGGSGLSERERGRSRLGQLGAIWAGWSPGCGQLGSWPLSFILFSFCFLFFCSEFLFGVLKSFFYSDLK